MASEAPARRCEDVAARARLAVGPFRESAGGAWGWARGAMLRAAPLLRALRPRAIAAVRRVPGRAAASRAAGGAPRPPRRRLGVGAQGGAFGRARGAPWLLRATRQGGGSPGEPQVRCVPRPPARAPLARG